MPTMEIINLRGERVVVRSAEQFKAEMNAFEAAIQELLPIVDGHDEAAADRAIERYYELGARLNGILEKVPHWNELARQEHRRAERAQVAQLIRERRPNG